MGTGTRYWLEGEGMRVEVTVISDHWSGMLMPGMHTATEWRFIGVEQVSLEIRDAENSAGPLGDLGPWSPEPSLDDLQPPPGW